MPHFSVPEELRSWVEIDPMALRHNLGVVRSRVGDRAGVLAVVKANGYGHGVRGVVRALAPGVEIFGVANLAEGREVAGCATGREIMLLSPCLPAERQAAVDEGFLVTVSSAGEAREYARCGPARVNFKIDTGMGRAGAFWPEAADHIRDILSVPEIQIHSISTHLPSSDEDEAFTGEQLELFSQLLENLRKLVPQARVHVLNSAGILRFPASAGHLVRAGLVLYGISPIPEDQALLQPALAWKSRVTLVRDLPKGAGVSYGRTFIAPKDLRIGLLAIGYADGYPRHLSGRGAAVLIGGKACPILGRVTMDQVVVDLSASPETLSGDEAVLVGRQGDAEITATELAARAGTISWDLFTGISNRVARIFPDAEE